MRAIKVTSNYTYENIVTALNVILEFSRSADAGQSVPALENVLSKSGAGSAASLGAPSGDEVTALQVELRSLIDAYARPVTLEPGLDWTQVAGLEFRSLRYLVMAGRRGQRQVMAVASLRDATLKTLIDILTRFPDVAQIEPCPECSTLFVRHGKAKYCSPRCTRRALDAKRARRLKAEKRRGSRARRSSGG